MARVHHHTARKVSTHPKPVKTKATGETAHTKAATKAAEVKAPEAPKKRDDYGKLNAQTVASTTPKADALTPAMTRAFYTLAKQFETEDAAGPLASAAMREFAKSPEAVAAFKQVVPYLESSAVAVGTKLGAPVIANVAKATLPLMADGKMVKALLKAGYEVGGVSGRRLVGAAMRGLNAGKGVGGAAAEIAATSAKIAAKAPALGAVAGGVGKALPVIGNAMNVVAVGTSLKTLWDYSWDKTKTKGQCFGQVMHLASTVTGCFVPPAAALAIGMDVKRAVTT